MKKILKIIGYTLLGILVLLVVLGVILPKDLSLSVSQTIAAQPNYIYNVLVDPSIKGWSDLEKRDSSAIYSYNDLVGKGAGYSWKGDKESGRNEIYAVDVNKSVTKHVYFNDDEDPKVNHFVLTPNGEATDVSIDWSGHFGFPKNIMGPFITRKLKAIHKKNLENISKLVAKRKDAEYRGFNVVSMDVAEEIYIANRSEVNTANVQQYYSQNLSSIFRTLQESNIETIGPDCALIYKFDNKTKQIDIAAALPIGEDIAIPNTTTIILPRANAVSVNFYGNRADSAPAHQAIQEYLRDRKLVAQLPYIEEYVTDVLAEKDPSKWLTKITYRIVE